MQTKTEREKLVAKNTTNPMATLFHFLLLSAILAFFPLTTSQLAPAAGEWRLLQESIGLSAMHMQLLPGDKVVMFDRADFGPSNLSLPASLCYRSTNSNTDCTAHSLLYDLPSDTLRPLNLRTDVWCSSGALLPNGTLLQTGGFNTGDRAVRSLSSNSTNWSEHPGYLSVRRWYATDQILPDGRILILGGRRQFSYEFFPSTGTAIPFPFLQETRNGTSENNLYPFVHLLPDGTLFIFANTRAVILDYRRHHILLRLPAIPGGSRRNYPSTGSSVLLPLNAHSPHAEILICGGARRGSYEHARTGHFLPADHTCGRIAPLDSNPVWSMEDMPLPRVMGDMLLLPTGSDVLILNGAASGTAGWELARDPVTRPVLYRPVGPAGSRFRILAQAKTARLYHSSAVVDTYGRVLVGGSNPHVHYNFTYGPTYSTQLSLEVFHPPYLDEGLDQVRPTIVAGDGVAVQYGESVRVRFTVELYQPWEELRMVLLAPSFTTHSLAMNQRAVLLPVSWVVQVALLTYVTEAALPTVPEVAPPGYYLLFVVHAEVPSQGVWIRILQPINA